MNQLPTPVVGDIVHYVARIETGGVWANVCRPAMVTILVEEGRYTDRDGVTLTVYAWPDTYRHAAVQYARPGRPETVNTWHPRTDCQPERPNPFDETQLLKAQLATTRAERYGLWKQRTEVIAAVRRLHYPKSTSNDPHYRCITCITGFNDTAGPIYAKWPCETITAVGKTTEQWNGPFTDMGDIWRAVEDLPPAAEGSTEPCEDRTHDCPPYEDMHLGVVDYQGVVTVTQEQYDRLKSSQATQGLVSYGLHDERGPYDEQRAAGRFTDDEPKECG